MPTDANDLFPPEPLISGARTLVHNGLMQTDMDAQGYRILHLDTSNLVLDELPSQAAQVNKWFNSYNQGTHSFGVAQPAFSNISGNLLFSQQRAITRLGTISEGIWQGTQITGTYVPALNFIRAPSANVTMAHKRITDLGDPVNDEDAVNLRLINNLASGLHPKPAVRCATTTNMALATLDHPVDGVTLASNDRVLVKDQTGSRIYQNGIWNAQGGAWTRADDMNVVAEFETATCFVLEGDTHANETWLQITDVDDIHILVTDPPPYPQFRLLSRSDTVQAGDGLDQTGNLIFAVGTADRISVGATIDIDTAYVGQTSITTLGTVDTGTWESDVITGEFGGTGVNNVGKTITLAGDFVTSLGLAAPIGAYLHFVLNAATTLILPPLGTVATTNQDETFTNKHISADQVDSGVLLITNGGTSANTAMAALANLLPDVTGHAGESLHTDGGTSGPAIFYWA